MSKDNKLLCHDHKNDKYTCKHCDKSRRTVSYFTKRSCSRLTLYCAEFTHYRTGESFYKVGVTSKTLDERFDELRERFDIKVIWDVEGPLEEVVEKETEILYQLEKDGRKYVPSATFSGYGECFR